MVDRLRSALSGRYTIEREIGRGGMATVYRAQDLRYDRAVAIKVLEPQLGVAIGADRFLREIAIEARLQHPHVLPVLDSGQVDQFLYYVMPFADGGSLADRLERERPLAMDEALRIIREVGDGLAHAHRSGVIHRDVKPANILFSAGHAMIADFGLARAVAELDRERLTTSGVTVGTPAYMSPEQATGEQPLDPRADVYSLGCVLFEMLVGDPPFTGPNARVVLARQLAERPPSVEVARPEVPSSVARAVRRALAKVPADRHPSIDAFLNALDRPVAEEDARRRARRRLWASAALASAAAAVFTGAWLLARADAESLSTDRVAVFPLSTRGLGVTNEVDGAGVAYLIEAALEQAGPLRLLDVTAHLEERQLADPALISAADARRIALALGAAHYVTGVVQGHRDSTTVIVRVHDVRGDSLLAQQSATGAAGMPLHHLGIDALLGVLPVLIDPGIEYDLGSLRDRRADAVALWWQGEREYRHSKFAAALDLYERALASDSSLAIAAVKGAQAADWVHDAPRGAALAAWAVVREPLLPERYATLARGLDAFFRGAADSAAHWLAEANRLHPDWWEAAAALGELYYHMLPVRAAPLDSLARAAFERGLAADSFSPSAFHLAEIRIRNGELGDADRLLDRFRRAPPDPLLLSQLTLMRECVGRPQAMRWDAHTERNAVAVFLAGKSLSAAGLQPQCAEGALRAVLRSAGAQSAEGWGAFLGLQGLLVATGRDREAQLLIDSVARVSGTARSLYVLNTLAGASMEEPAAQLEAFARERFGETYEGVVNTQSLWVLSAWLQHAGDRQGFEHTRRLIAERAARASATMSDRLFAEAVAARAAFEFDNDTTRAIAHLAALPSSDPLSLQWEFGAALPPERLLLARLLLQRGLYRGAIHAASVFDHPGPVLFLPYLPASLEIRLRAARALGDRRGEAQFRSRLERLYRMELVAEQP